MRSFPFFSFGVVAFFGVPIAFASWRAICPSSSLGYRVEDRALHVVEQEAEFVRSLFRSDLEIVPRGVSTSPVARRPRLLFDEVTPHNSRCVVSLMG